MVVVTSETNLLLVLLVVHLIGEVAVKTVPLQITLTLLTMRVKMVELMVLVEVVVMMMQDHHMLEEMAHTVLL